MTVDEYAAPEGLDDALDRQLRVAELQWVGIARGTLIFLGVVYLLLGASMPILYGGMASTQPGVSPDEATVMAVAGGVGTCVTWVFTIPMFLGAWGLKRGRKWAWFVTLILGAMMTPSACLPIGVILLYAMLQEDVRKAFLD